MVSINLKHLVLAASISLYHNKPKPVITFTGTSEATKLVDSLYRNLTLSKLHPKEFVLCSNGNKMFFPEQTATMEGLEYVPCDKSFNGTIHSHPTHLDGYLCEPSDTDNTDFINSKQKYMGIACYDSVHNRVYVNNYDIR